MSLQSARSGVAGVRVASPRVLTPLRSDRAALRSGFLRVDRSPVGIVRIQRPTSNVARVEPVRVIRGNDQAVLDLFGDSAEISAPPAGGLGRVSHAWPLPSSVAQKFTSGYGTRNDPFHGRPSFHGGVDIAAATGTSVLASADGVVTKVENGSRFGKYVTVRHRDGTESSYGHLNAQSVHIGQNVRQGQKLGELGATGRATGPHLDYRIKKNGEGFDPMLVLHAPATTGIRVASSTVRVTR